MRYHHIWELVTNKKREDQKVDIEVNIINNLRKPLLDHCFGALRRQMGLQQAKENRQAESEVAVKESKVERAKQPEKEKWSEGVERAKRLAEPISQRAKEPKDRRSRLNHSRFRN